MAITVLLVGNSRLHWGLGKPQTWDWGPLLQRWDGDWPPWPVQPTTGRWAAVGTISPSLQTSLSPWPPPVKTPQVPLTNCPAHVGVDRALGAWQAFCSKSSGGGVLVVDAGTALTMTVVTATGCFGGGRILPGVALQLKSLHQGTASLPAVESPVTCPWRREGQTSLQNSTSPGLATDTVNAMVDGVIHGLSAAVASTTAELMAAAAITECWLTGGDASLLHGPICTQLGPDGPYPHHDPDLALKALLRL